MPACVVSVINYKGGVGKTTLTANLGADLAARGRRVLLVDLDPQASLTFSLIPIAEYEEQLARERTLLQWFEKFVRTGQVEPLHDYAVLPLAVNDAARGNGGELHLLASHLGLIEMDLDLAASLGGARFLQAHPRYLVTHRLLADAMDDHTLGHYDVVLIDCAPNFNMITRVGIVASDHLIVPARPDYLSTLGIDYLRSRLSRLVDQYAEVSSDPIAPEILGVVHTMIQYTPSGVLAAQRQSMENLERAEIPAFRQTIRDNKTAFTDSGLRAVPVVLSGDHTAAVENLRLELQHLTSEFIAKTRV